jgi:uncharacterized protein (TIGR02058 family)
MAETEHRIILETGTGNDLYGEDYTKAACRAVQDALHHSSITMFRSLGMDHARMRVQVTIAVQQPDKVDTAVGRRRAAARQGRSPRRARRSQCA